MEKEQETQETLRTETPQVAVDPPGRICRDCGEKVEVRKKVYLCRPCAAKRSRQKRGNFGPPIGPRMRWRR